MQYMTQFGSNSMSYLCQYFCLPFWPFPIPFELFSLHAVTFHHIVYSGKIINCIVLVFYCTAMEITVLLLTNQHPVIL